MKLAIAGDSAGEGLAKVLADHLKDRHEVHEVSHTDAGPDAFYATLSDRVASAVHVERHAGNGDDRLMGIQTHITLLLAQEEILELLEGHERYALLP